MYKRKFVFYFYVDIFSLKENFTTSDLMIMNIIIYITVF